MLTLTICTLLVAFGYPFARSLPAAAILALTTVSAILLLNPSLQAAPIAVHLAAVSLLFVGVRWIMPLLTGDVKPGAVVWKVGRVAVGFSVMPVVT